MRLRRKHGIDEKLNNMTDVVISNPSQHKGAWSAVFANDNPIHLELGTGKGSFLSGMAQLNPQVNYLGVERVPDILYLAALKLEAEQRPNARLLMVDAENLSEYFVPGEIGRIYLNFSDPWPKKRHAKRRLTHPRFLQIYQDLLPPGGEIHLKTDNLDFFEYSLHSFVSEGFSLRRITYDLHRSCIKDNVMTEYERRFSSLGQPIYRVEAFTPLAAGNSV